MTRDARPGLRRRTRRDALRLGGGAASLALGAAFGHSVPALSQDAKAGTAGVAVRRASLGAGELVILSDGHMVVPTAMLAGNVAEADLRAFLAARAMDGNRLDFHINVALVRTGNEFVLVDAGAGVNWEPTAGKLAESLEQAGIRPEQIGTVIVSHAHPDHLWGLVDELDDSLRFPNAKYVMSEREFRFWKSSEAAGLQGPIEGIAAGARRVLKAIEDRLTFVKPGAEAAPGIVAIDTAGHTPGHISLLVNSVSRQVLITGDAIQNAHVSFAHPEWRPRADMDGEGAVRSRRTTLDMAAADGLLVLSYHIPFPGLGRVERKGTAFSWIAAA